MIQKSQKEPKKHLKKTLERSKQRLNQSRQPSWQKCSKQALFLLLIGVKRLVLGATFNKLNSQVTSLNVPITCSETSYFGFYNIHFEDSTTRVYSFNLDGSKVGAAPKFIDNEYGMYELGNDCYMHATNQIVKDQPIFVLVFERSADPNEKCKLARIITRGPITTCSGSPTNILTAVIGFKKSDDSAATSAAFSKISRAVNTPHGNYQSLKSWHISIDDASFSFASIDDQFLEMMLMNVIINPLPTPVSMIRHLSFKEINDHIGANPFAVLVNPGDFAKRLIQDELPGYYLDVYNGDPATDDSSKVLAQRLYLIGHRTAQLQFYIPKPSQIAVGETHGIQFKVRYFKSTPGNTANPRLFEYNIQVTRTATHLNFGVKRGTTDIPGLNMAKAYTGGDKFIYVNFNFGKGVLYWVDKDNAKSKTYETLHVFEVGQAVQSKVNSFETSSEQIPIILNIKPYSSYSSLTYSTVEYKPHSGVTTNKAGFRVLTLRVLDGVVPPSLVATMNPGSYSSRCYYTHSLSGNCLAMAHLSDLAEPQFLDYVEKGTTQVMTASAELASACRVVFGQNKCLWPKPNYISNLEEAMTLPLDLNGNLPLADYEALTDQTIKGFATEVTSNTGRKYLVGCPETCGKCSPTTLECTECLDGATVDTGECPIDNCEPITSCLKCGAGGTCAWCGSNKILQPDKMSCSSSSSCPAGSGFRSPTSKYECLTCASQAKCQTCSNGYEICEACTNPAHRLLDVADKARFPSGTNLIGKKDCFDPAEITDYFYTDSTSFKPCKSSCKKCTTANDCSECGNHLDPSGTAYIQHGVSPMACWSSSECTAANNRFPVPGTSPPECHECPAGQFYVEGSNPPQCTACDTGAVFVEAATKLCKPCSPECSLCTGTASYCLACSDSSLFAQPDGTCKADCPARYMGISGPPKTCRACPANCSACSEELGCTACNAGFMAKNKVCEECGTGCTDCQHAGCQACQVGLKLEEKQCVQEKTVKLEIIEKSYIDAPSRLRLVFSAKIESKASTTNVEIVLNQPNSGEKIGTKITEVTLEDNKKGIKFYFEAEKEDVDDAILSISFKEPNLIWAEGNPESPYTDQKIESEEKVSYFRPKSEIKYAKATAVVSSASLSVIGLVSLVGSYSSIFDLIKMFQMLDFLVFYNVPHPANLEAFLSNIELALIEKIPNPLKNFKDELCHIERAKFEEDGVTCYILSDQGRYLVITLGIFLYSLLIRALAWVSGVDCLKTFVKNSFGIRYWVDFLEAIRFEIFIVVLLSLGKADLLGGEILSKFTVNLVASVIFGGLNVAIIIYQFMRIKKDYSRIIKMKSILGEKNKTQKNKERGKKVIEKNFSKKDMGISDLESLSRQSNKKRLQKSNLGNFEENTEKEFPESQKKQEEEQVTGAFLFSEDYKSDSFYQRNHQPLLAIKEVIATTAVVALYNYPHAQTLTITAALAIFLCLDIYYRPYKDTTDNIDLIITTTILVLISASLSSLSFIDQYLSRKATFYAVGYFVITMVGLLIFRNIFLALNSVYQWVKKMLRQQRAIAKREKRSGKEIKKAVWSEVEEPGEGSQKVKFSGPEGRKNRRRDRRARQKKSRNRFPRNRSGADDEEEEEKKYDGTGSDKGEESLELPSFLPKKKTSTMRRGVGGRLFRPKKKRGRNASRGRKGRRKDHKI